MALSGILPFILLLGLLAAAPIRGSGDSPVIALDDASFQSQVLGTAHVWLVEFSQDKCQPCMDFWPDYTSVAIALRGTLKVASLSCSAFPDICAQEGIQRLPAVKGYGWKVQTNPYTKKTYKEALLYNGPLRYKAVSEFGTSLLPSEFVQNVSAGSTLDEFLAAPETPKVLLFSSKKSVAPMLKSLSLRFRTKLAFAQASSADSVLVEQYGITQFPTILVIQPGQKEPTAKYDGKVSPEDIAAFLRQFAPEAPATDSAGEGAAGAEKANGPGWVRAMDAEKFFKDVLRNDEIYVVAFVDASAADDCEAKVAAWRSEAQQLQGLVFVGEMNVTTTEQKAELEKVYKRPVSTQGQCVSVWLFPFGDDKEDTEPKVVSGDLTAKALTQAVYETAPSSFVKQLTASTFDVFAFDNMLKPKVVLFSSKEDVPGMFRVLSTNFRHGNLFGMVHESETELVERFKISKFPQIFCMFPQAQKLDKSDVQLATMAYQGPVNYMRLMEFVVQLTGQVRNDFGYLLDIPKMDDDAAFEEHCLESGRLCVLGLFAKDSVPEAFQRVAGKWEGGGQFSFLWVHAAPDAPGAKIARQLQVPESALPTAVVLAPAKQRLAVLGDDFSGDALNAFLDGVLLGKIRTLPLEVLPSYRGEDVEASTRLTGAEGSAEGPNESPAEPGDTAPLEEEFSLEDVLSEAVDEEGAISREQKLQELEKQEEEERKKEESKKKKKKKKSKKKKAKAASKDEL